jgi:FkbM family methyltransferase
MSRAPSHKELVVVLGLALVFLATYHPAGQWRIRAVALKLTTELPGISWNDVFAELAGSSETSKVEPLVRGSVTLRELEGTDLCPALWQTPQGPIWGQFRDEEVLEVLISKQLLRKSYEAGPAKIQRGDIVLDVGSHLGTFTQYALNQGARLVVAFEPEPTNVACFKKSFEKEINEKNVILVEAAAWETETSLRFRLEGADNSGMGKIAEAGELVVPAVTIDETVGRLGLDRVDFIKMDIEGSERHALAGALRTLSGFGPRMALATYHRPDDPEVIAELVLKARPSYRQLRRTAIDSPAGDQVHVVYFY